MTRDPCNLNPVLPATRGEGLDKIIWKIKSFAFWCGKASGTWMNSDYLNLFLAWRAFQFGLLNPLFFFNVFSKVPKTCFQPAKSSIFLPNRTTKMAYFFTRRPVLSVFPAQCLIQGQRSGLLQQWRAGPILDGEREWKRKREREILVCVCARWSVCCCACNAVAKESAVHSAVGAHEPDAREDEHISQPWRLQLERHTLPPAACRAVNLPPSADESCQRQPL